MLILAGQVRDPRGSAEERKVRPEIGRGGACGVVERYYQRECPTPLRKRGRDPVDSRCSVEAEWGCILCPDTAGAARCHVRPHTNVGY
ncbi:hypothetical protein NDU88_006585 [Pleurodeles waltl]|uniref:Uncharacterized protein n=1 Tax=Pleurodeles waltl TaxID=8319 RepID=A0AAV7N1E9_PLEWA|nr:hypothetical protein NDU88_006585 [Pleurodeles waltl]